MHEQTEEMVTYLYRQLALSMIFARLIKTFSNTPKIWEIFYTSVPQNINTFAIDSCCQK
jgi:hypothetical protein